MKDDNNEEEKTLTNPTTTSMLGIEEISKKIGSGLIIQMLTTTLTPDSQSQAT